jgi:hypothetical protein
MSSGSSVICGTPVTTNRRSSRLGSVARRIPRICASRCLRWGMTACRLAGSQSCCVSEKQSGPNPGNRRVRQRDVPFSHRAGSCLGAQIRQCGYCVDKPCSHQVPACVRRSKRFADPDLNPIELAFAKPKPLLRVRATRTGDAMTRIAPTRRTSPHRDQVRPLRFTVSGSPCWKPRSRQSPPDRQGRASRGDNVRSWPIHFH